MKGLEVRVWVHYEALKEAAIFLLDAAEKSCLCGAIAVVNGIFVYLLRMCSSSSGMFSLDLTHYGCLG